jgi:hypothetical protein
MCGHLHMYHHPYQLQRHQPVWRCSTCGREAYRPLDCCAQPDFAPRQYVTLGRRCARGLVAMGQRVLTRLGAILPARPHRPALPAVSVPCEHDAEDMAAVPVGADDGAETAMAVAAPAADGASV